MKEQKLNDVSKAYTLRAQDKDLYDLAILIFKDTHQNYEEIFRDNKIEISSSDEIPDKFVLKYEIHGCNLKTHFDFEGYNFDEDKKGNVIDLSKEGFSYPNINIGSKRDGAAIVQPYNDGKYGIVGIHRKNKSGVALTNDKCQWINRVIQSYRNK